MGFGPLHHYLFIPKVYLDHITTANYIGRDSVGGILCCRQL